MSSVSLPVAAMRVHWASWRASEGRAAEELDTVWVSCGLDGAVEAMVDSSAHAAMTRWMFVVMRVESWRSWCASARVWVGREVDIVSAGEMPPRCSEG